MQPRCANYRSQKVQSVDSKASRPTTTNEKTMCETYRQFHGSLSYYYLVYIIVNRGSSIYTISKHNRNKKLFFVYLNIYGHLGFVASRSAMAEIGIVIFRTQLNYIVFRFSLQILHKL